MSVDIAELELVVDAAQVRTATADLDRLGDAGERMGRRAADMQARLDALTTTTERSADAAKKAADAQRSLTDNAARLRRELDQTSAAADLFNRALGVLGIGIGLGQLVAMTDQYAKFTAQLRLATDSTRAYHIALSEVARIAKSSQASLGDTGNLFARITRSTRDMGVPMQQVSKLTESITLAMKVSGASAEETASAMHQLSQGFAAGALRGEEFNIVAESAPRLMEALAEGMGTTTGALRAMAAAGKLTGAAMAEALPKSLDKLREEAKHVQTISAAFQVLTDAVMVFVGTQAQASGAVSVITASFGQLAQHIDLVAIALAGLTATKVATWIVGWVSAAALGIKASLGQAAAANVVALAEARAAAVTTAAALAKTNAYALEAAFTAKRAHGLVDLIKTQQLTVAANSAEARSLAAQLLPALEAARVAERNLTVAREANLIAANGATIAAQRLAAANAAAAAGATLATRAMAGLRAATAFLGGPIGVVITALTLGAMAWTLWGDAAKEGNDKALASMEETGGEMIDRLEKQLVKLRERNKLINEEPRLKKLGGVPEVDIKGLAARKAELDAARDGTGVWADKPQYQRQLAEIDLLHNYERALSLVAETQEEVKIGAKATLGRDLAEWYGKHGSNAQKLAYELGELKKKFGEVLPADMVKIVSDKYKDKQAEKEANAFDRWTASMKAKTAAQEEEIATGEKQRQSDKETWHLEQLIAKGTVKRGSNQEKAARAQIGDLARNEDTLKAIETEKQLTAAIDDSVRARREQAKLVDLDARIGISRDARALEKIAIEGQTWAEEKLAAVKAKGGVASDQQIARIQAEAAARVALHQQDYRQGKGDDDKTAKMTRELLDAAAAAKTFGDAMAEAFGRAGSAIGYVIEGLANHKVELDKVEVTRKDAVKYAENEQAVAAANAKAKKDTVQLQLKGYADMAGAAKGFFKENTSGYKAMEAAEKAFRLFELAMSAQTMFVKMGLTKAFTTLFVSSKATETAATVASVGPDVAASTAKGMAAAAAGVANQAQGDPYSAFVRMAVMAAAMAALGFAVSGGGGGPDTTAKDRQAKQGTGSVFGAADAKSESIARAVELSANNSKTLLNYTAGMLRALTNIQNSLGNLGNLVVGQVGGKNSQFAGIQTGTKPLGGTLGLIGGTAGGAALGYAAGAGLSAFTALGSVGGPIGMAIGAVVGWIASKLTKTKTTVVDEGLTFGPQRLGTVQDNGLAGQAYADVNTKKSFIGFKYSDKTRRQFGDLSPEMGQQFSLVLQAMAEGIDQAASLIGIGGDAFTHKLRNFVVNLGDISLKDLSGGDITKQLEAVFSKAGDDMAKYAVAGLGQFQRVGEGYLETLVRVAADYANVNAILASIGMTFKTVGLHSIGAREHLIALAGGIEALAGKTEFFAQNFLTEAQRLAPVAKYVTAEMTKLGFASVDTRAEFTQLALSLDVSTAAGAATFVALMDLAEAFAAVHAAAVDTSMTAQQIADQRRSLQDQIDELTMTGLQLRAKERLSIHDSNRALFDQLMARGDIAAAYDKESSALATTIARMKTFGASLTSLISSLNQGALSPLTPEQKAIDARRTYEELLAKAKAGDEGAQGQVGAAAQAYLTADRVIHASSARYGANFIAVQQELAALRAAAGVAQTEAEAQLAAMKTLVGTLVNLDQSTVSLTAAIANLNAALAAERAATLKPERDYDKGSGAAVLRPFLEPGSANVALVAEVKALREEVAALRVDNERQAQTQATATLVAADANADKVAASGREAVQANAFHARAAKKGALA